MERLAKVIKRPSIAFGVRCESAAIRRITLSIIAMVPAESMSANIGIALSILFPIWASVLLHSILLIEGRTRRATTNQAIVAGRLQANSSATRAVASCLLTLEKRFTYSNGRID